ncbi:MAG TPA: D-lactate dehydrogenase family protein [Chondromyces sp.]|nr:D-lactate dehydrogenase family protein [Chondromyces sp.]
MTEQTLEEFLSSGAGLLAGLPPEVVRQFAKEVERRHLAHGELLFREGEPGRFMFIVERGALEVLKGPEEGRASLLRVMLPGEAGGLTSMAVAKTRSATLRARGPASVLTVPRERFLILLDELPDLRRGLLAELSRKVRDKTARIAALTGDSDRQATPVLVYDAKPYDRDALDEAAGDDLELHYLETRLEPATSELARGFAVVCAFVNDDLGADTLKLLASGGTGLVAMRCSGFNNVDLEAAAELGITVVRVPSYSPEAVAEHTMALILALNRKIHRAYNRVREGNFSLTGLVGFNLHGRTAGIVGLGSIGRALAANLRGIGMKVLASDPALDEATASDLEVDAVDLEDLLGRSDVVSLHAPLMPATHHLLDRKRIAAMKAGAMLINTSRGGLVNTAALIDALKSGHLGAAGLDVYEEESEYFFEDRSGKVIKDDLLARLMTFPNVIVTSHQAFLTHEALHEIATTTVSSIRDYIAGRELRHRVSSGGS